jgi:hypothetical protein
MVSIRLVTAKTRARQEAGEMSQYDLAMKISRIESRLKEIKKCPF